MANIIEMSHAINSDSTSRAAMEAIEKRAKEEAKPKPVPPPASAATKVRASSQAQKAQEAVHKETVEEIKAKVRGKIREYLESKKIGGRLLVGGYEMLPERCSLSEHEEYLESIRRHLKREYKSALVLGTWKKIVKGSEKVMVYTLQMEQYRGVGDYITVELAEEFEADLEEIAIEMGDDWVPNAKIRLGLRLLDVMLNYTEIRETRARKAAANQLQDSDDDSTDDEKGPVRTGKK